MPGSRSHAENRGDGPHLLSRRFCLLCPGPPDETVVREPVVVFEVLTLAHPAPTASRSCANTGQRSIQRYVVLEQDSIAATVFSRLNAAWNARVLTAGRTLAIPEIDVYLLLANVYADVTLPETDLG
jgi:hypothetical protein